MDITDIRNDPEISLAAYRLHDTSNVVPTGIPPIDIDCGGAQQGELWVHASAPGEYKSTFAFNWSYNLIVACRNVLFVTNDMPTMQVRRNIDVLHSTHPRWRERMQLPLSYAKIRDGKLSEREYKFYENLVREFSTSSDYGRLYVTNEPLAAIRPEDVTNVGPSLIVIDTHPGMSPNYVNWAKYLALSSLVPVLLLWQTNRRGKEQASKTEGVYPDIDGLSCPEAIQTKADIVTTSCSLGRDANGKAIVKFSNLKNRRSECFTPFSAEVDLDTRRLRPVY